jgi:uncharacterized protein
MGGMNQRIDEETLELEYPCRWQYRLIGRSEDAMRAAVSCIIGDFECSIAPSHRSRSGVYCSVLVTVLVPDEPTRTRIYHSMKNHVDVMMVL